MKSLFLLGLLSIAQPESAPPEAPVAQAASQELVEEEPERFEAFSETVLADMEARYISTKRLPSELQYRINRNFDYEGVIFIGRIKKPEDADISALVTIEKDGSFASAVAPDRKLIFYAHGYRPIVLEALEPAEGPLYDVGEISFEPLETELQPSLTAIAVTRDTDFEQEIEARLTINHRDFLGRSGGTWQARYRPIVARQTIRHGERVTFTGLGLNPYLLELWSDGYVVETVELRPEEGEAADLDALVVTPAKKFKFRAIGNFDVEKDTSWPDFVESEVVANGKNQFVYHQERQTNRMKSYRMRLEPDREGVALMYPVIPTEYYDLGQIDIEAIGAADLTEEALAERVVERPIYLQSGHVYFMQNKRRKVNALFEATLLED